MQKTKKENKRSKKQNMMVEGERENERLNGGKYGHIYI